MGVLIILDLTQSLRDWMIMSNEFINRPEAVRMIDYRLINFHRVDPKMVRDDP